MTELVNRLKKIFSYKGGKNSEAVLNLSWDYSTAEADGRLKLFDPHRVAREINGYFLKGVDGLSRKGTLVPNPGHLQADGSTSCGNWLYCASYTEEGNLAARRDNSDPSGLGLYPRWSWSWPNNCRILHNRASVREKGHGIGKAVTRWDGHSWVGDVPDGDRLSVEQKDDRSLYPFSMLPEGLAQIFGPGMADGPFPEHYEPLECPIEKNLLSSQRLNPTIRLLSSKGVMVGEDRFMTCDPKFPIVCTTYRVSEHWQTGVMSRRQPWLLELQPCVFVEMCRELAEDKEIANGEVCLIKSARGNLEAVALVTDRLQPLLINNQKIYHVGLPWHFGWMGPQGIGDSANILTPSIGDANTMIPETKAFLVDVVKKD